MRRKAGANQGQASFFDIIINNQQTFPHQAGSLDIDRELRESISLALKQSPVSRYHIAATMSEMTGTDITKSRLDSWTAESKDGHRFPAIFMPALCVATGSTEPLKALTRRVGVFVLPGEDALRSEIRRFDEEITHLKAERQKRVVLVEAQKGA